MVLVQLKLELQSTDDSWVVRHQVGLGELCLIREL